jgi:acyl homoserine lactone synthase
VFIREGGFFVKDLVTGDENARGYRLRHEVFSKELSWVPENGDGLERDSYDESAVGFGVFDGHHELCAHLRLLLPPGRFMLEKEFSGLVGPGHQVRKERDTAEVSRLCVAAGARNRKVQTGPGAYSIPMFLYKGVYHWCIRHGVRRLYLVVEYKVLRLLLAQGFPCKLIGSAGTMPDGVTAVAAEMDWREFEALNAKKRPPLLRWFTQRQSNPVPLPPQRPGAFLPRQAYA